MNMIYEYVWVELLLSIICHTHYQKICKILIMKGNHYPLSPVGSVMRSSPGWTGEGSNDYPEIYRNTDFHIFMNVSPVIVCGGTYWPACIFVHSLIKPSPAELHRSVFTNKLIDLCLWHGGKKEKIGFWGPPPPLPLSDFTLNHFLCSWFPLICKCVCLCVSCVFSHVMDDGLRLWQRPPPLSFFHAGLSLHAWMGDERQLKHWNWNLSRSPTISLAGRDISYASAVWDWRRRDHTWSLGSFTGSPEMLIWNRSKDEHVSKSMKTSSYREKTGKKQCCCGLVI